MSLGDVFILTSRLPPLRRALAISSDSGFPVFGMEAPSHSLPLGCASLEHYDTLATRILGLAPFPPSLLTISFPGTGFCRYENSSWGVSYTRSYLTPVRNNLDLLDGLEIVSEDPFPPHRFFFRRSILRLFCCLIVLIRLLIPADIVLALFSLVKWSKAFWSFFVLMTVRFVRSFYVIIVTRTFTSE